MTLDLVENHNKLTQTINEGAKNLNGENRKIDDIREVILKRDEIAHTLENQIIHPPRSFWRRHRVKITVGVTVVSILGAAALNLVNVFQYFPTTPTSASTQNSTSDAANSSNGPEGRAISISAVALGAFGVLTAAFGSIWEAWNNSQEDRERQALEKFYNDKKIEEVGDKTFLRFLNALDEFDKTQRERRTEDQVKACVTTLKEIPDNAIHKDQIEEATIIKNLVLELPETNPLFKAYQNLVETTDNVNELHSNIDPEESSSDDYEFGEKGAPAKHLLSMSDLQETSKDIPFKAMMEKVSVRKRSFHNKWKEFENRLGHKLSRLEIRGKQWNHEGQEVNNIPQQLIPQTKDIAINFTNYIENDFNTSAVEL